MRQARSWNLVPFTAVLAPGLTLLFSPSNRIQRNYKGQKQLCTCLVGENWATRYKKTKTQLPLLRYWD